MSTQLARRVERLPFLFDDFFNGPLNDWFNGGLQAKMTSVPMVNISERKDDYLVSIAAPGLKKEDFKIDVEGNRLSISSEKEETREEEEEEKYTRNEYNYSSFERSFTLPDEVNKEKIDARYKNGVLEVVLPKKRSEKNDNQ
ncbi:MAG: Hsp20/alpha crystallin family protein [Ginsengibacter sp.]